jgi:hypothetical protein
MSLQTRNPLDTVMSLQLPPGQRGHDTTANIAGHAQSQSQNPYNTQLYPGVVVRASTGSYDTIVRTSSHPKLPCVQAATSIGSLTGFGTTDTHLIGEGELVLVYVPDPKCNYGIILCALPPMYLAGHNEHMHVAMLEAEPGAAQFTEQAHIKPHKSSTDVYTLSSGAGRAVDAFPGDQAWHNELGISLAIRKLMLHMKASDRAKLEMFLLDDLVRLNTGQFQHYHPLGESHVYNTRGNCTMELSGSQHQCEVMGYPNYGTPFVKSVAADSTGAKQSGLGLNAPDATMMRRLSYYLGHLPGILQFFVTSPAKGAEMGPDVPGPMTYGAKAVDKGLMHFAVDDNGRCLLRSASDITIERCDHIAVPKKLREPWDPISHRYSETEAKLPWLWGNDDLRSRPLQQRDASKWWLRSVYTRFWKNSLTDDLYLPEENEVMPDNAYDTVEGSNEDYAATSHVRKSCSITLRKDGGITVREHGGAELSLVDGRIIMSAPKGVEIRSGTSIVNLANEDFVAKARESVDITATNKDLRLKAEHNMQAWAGNSVLVECDAPSGSTPPATDAVAGESTPAMGITLKATNSRIFAWGATVHLAALTNIFIETTQNAVGAITLATRRLWAACRECVLATSATTGLILNPRAAYLTGRSATVIGQTNAAVIKGSKAMQPLTWSDVGYVPHSSLAPTLDRVYGFWEDYTWLTPFEPVTRDNWMFSFRDAAQCGTASDFKVYESLWAYQARKLGVAVEWEERSVNDTYPWPGNTNYEGTPYYTLDTEKNVDDTVTGMPKPIGSRVREGAGFTPHDFHHYAG